VTGTEPPVAPGPSAPARSGTDDCPVAAVMLRVQEQLRRGAAPSFESLLALGVPGGR
jgi:hypothetical protein